VIAVTSEHLKHSRITLTFPVLNHAREVIFMVTGEEKAPIIKQIIQDHVEFPAAQVCPVNGKRTFYLDRGAAQQITPSQPFIHDGDAIVITN
jgi:6-phosphogluconolactonase